MTLNLPVACEQSGPACGQTHTSSIAALPPSLCTESTASPTSASARGTAGRIRWLASTFVQLAAAAAAAALDFGDFASAPSPAPTGDAGDDDWTSFDD